MATITTTTVTDHLAPPGNAPIVLQLGTGNLFAIFQAAAGTLSVWRSTNSGGSWASYASFTHASLAEWSSLVADASGYLHLAYRVSTTGGGGTDAIYYRRLNTSTAAWSGPTEATNDANGGTAGAVWQGLDIAVVRNSNGTYAILVAAAQTYPGVKYGVTVHGISINAAGTIYANDGIVSGTRYWYSSGTAPGRSGVQCEVEHTGDGFTPSNSTPHVWISWGRSALYMVKLSWQGSASGWAGPTSAITIRSSVGVASDFAAARWDGTRWMMAIASPDDTTKVRVYQRNKGNTATTTLDTPAHPTGIIRYCVPSYDRSSNVPLRVYAVGTSTAVLYYADYNRLTSTWSSWATVVAAAVSNSGVEWGIRKGGTSNNARYDVVTASGASSPFTITHTAQSITAAPQIPVLSALNASTGAAYTTGSPADVGANLQLSWTFSDPDPGDTQGSYAVSRQIGAGALAYWRASDSTWQASEVQNVSATSQLTLLAATPWGLDADAVHTYRVKVWDAGGAASQDYSGALQLVPSAKVNPTVVTPAAAAVLTTDTVTITWTVAQQTAYRVTLTNTGLGVLAWDTGKVTSTDLSYTVPVSMETGSAWQITLTTYNAEGLPSTQQVRAFTVAYAIPPAVISTVTPSTALGQILVASSALAAVGVQPAIVTQDLYRRVAKTPVLNANPSMAGNITGWAYGGGATPGTLTYSTTQAHDAPGSARYVPAASGGSALPQIESAGYTDIVAGSVYQASAWIRPDTANKPLVLLLNWYTGALAFISSTTYVVINPVANAWHYLEFFADPAAVPTAAKVRVGVGEANTPAAVDAWYADEIRLEVYNPDPGVRIAAAAAPGSAYADWGAPALTDLEYRWVARGANGTFVTGPWT
jgi:hypothetical protein